MRRYPIGFLSALAVAALVAAPPVFAQDGRVGSPGPPAESRLPAGGWIVTPSFLYSTGHDDNVLLKGRGDAPPADFVNVLNPQVEAGVVGRRGKISSSYDGAFIFYHDLNSLNSYDQRGTVSASRLLSKHVTLFVKDSFAAAPTTELSLLVGVPFVRTGAKVNDFGTGINADLTKRTSITASYEFTWVSFDSEPAFTGRLLGGHSHGGSVLLRHKRTKRMTLTLDYNRQFSTVDGPETFDVQNVAGGFDQTVSDALRVFAAAGISRVAANAFGPAHTSPSYHAGVVQRLLRTGSLTVAYDREFATAFGLGGTSETKDLSVRVNMPLARKVYTHSVLSWRANNYLQLPDTSLRSRWFEASIGYLAQPWVRIEGFYTTAYQTGTIPGTTLDRTRFGFQVVTAKPMRVR